jgi:hypothetical protein
MVNREERRWDPTRPGELVKAIRWRGLCSVQVADLFIESMSDGQILDVLRVMAPLSFHLFTINTTHVERARAWLAKWRDVDPPGDPVMAKGPTAIRAAHASGRAQLFADMIESWGAPPAGAAYPLYDWMEWMRWWPLAFRHITVVTHTGEKL